MTDDVFFIPKVKYCEALTKSGVRCSRRIKMDIRYCSQHAKVFKLDKPEDCPICSEAMNEIQPLSCSHWVHRSCILKWKDECPICRKKIKLTKNERRILERNRHQEGQEEDLPVITTLIQFVVPFSMNDQVDITELLSNIMENLPFPI